MLVDPVEDREAEAEERDLRVAGGELAVRVADEPVDRIGDEQRPEVPEVAVHPDVRPLAVRGGVEERLDLLLQLLRALGAEHVVRGGPHLEQEGDVAEQLVGVAVQRKTLGVQVGLAVGHGVHQLAAEEFLLRGMLGVALVVDDLHGDPRNGWNGRGAGLARRLIRCRPRRSRHAAPSARGRSSRSAGCCRWPG